MNKLQRGHFTLIMSIVGVFLSTCVVAEDIRVEQAYVRESPPGATSTAAYMLIRNLSDQGVKLVSAESTDESTGVSKISMHSHQHHQGLMAMRPVAEIIIPAASDFRFAPGGYHFMLTGLQQPLRAGNEVAFKLNFEDRTAVHVKVSVEPIAAHNSSSK